MTQRTRKTCRIVVAWVSCASAGLVLVSCSGSDGPDAPLPTTVSFGALGDTPGDFANPRAIDSDGEFVWVVDRTARVQRLDPETGVVSAMFRMPEHEVGKPTGITIAPGQGFENAVYIADTHYHRVMIYSPDSGVDTHPGRAFVPAEAEAVARFGSYGTGAGEFMYPTDIAVIADENDLTRAWRIYVSEYGPTDRVSCFDGGFNFLFSFGSEGDGGSADDIRFDRPQSLALVEVDGGMELLVADSGNHRLGRFTLGGELIGWIGALDDEGRGRPTRAAGGFNRPRGLADLGGGRVLVSEFGNNRVQVIDVSSGASEGVWGTPGRGRGELATPWGVTVSGERALVLDTGNNRVQGFTAPGLRIVRRR